VDSVVTQFDGLGRTWKQTRPYKAGVDMPQWSEVKYDLLGRPTETTAPDNVSKTYRYYDANAPAPAGASNAKGQTVRVKDQWGRERWARYDAQERLVEVVEPNESGNGTVATNGYVTTYQYDTLGRLTGTTQGSQTRSFKYDSLGRLTHQKLAEREATLDHNGNAGSAWSDYFSYDSRSNLTLRVDARRVRTTYSYYNNALGTDDPLNRLQSVSYDKSQAINSSLIPDAPSVTYSYLTTGNKGRLNTVNVGSGAITDALQYDSEGRLSQATQTFAERSGYPFVTNYLYDKLDRAKEIYYPAQYGDDGLQRKIEPTYDFSTRLTDLKFGGQNFASGIVYNAASQATSVGIGTSAGNPNAPVVTENYTYDQKTGLLTEQVVQQGSTKHLHLQYNYTTNNDPNNNGAKSGQLTGITDVLDGTRNRAYTYDALARLKEVKGGTNAFSSPTWWQSYSYDRYGNRGNVTMGGSPGTIPLDGITGLTYNTASNRITNASYEYDAAGNQTRGQVEGGVFKRFRYDAAGRLAEVRDDGDTTVQEKYTYGASSQRLMATQGSSETVYAWDGGQVVAEYSSATGSSALTWQKGYVYLGGRLLATVTPGGGKQYHHPDRLGTRLMTNADGSFAGRQESLPYGAMIDSSATTNRRFTTYDRSATTKLDYAVNRFYNAAQGRFTQVDPIEHEASGLADPQSLNLYAYCGNDPINHTDPDGLFFKKLFGAIGKIFKAIVIAVFVAGAILLTAGVAVAAFAGWAASAPFFEAFGALMGFFQAHKIIAGIVGIGSAGSFFTPGINGSGAGGVSYFLGGDDEPGLASRFIDWATTDGLQTASDFAAGWGDTLSLGLTRKIRQKMGTDDAVNPCSNAYRAGEIGGTLNSFVAGGASVARGALAMGGRSGTLMQRFGRGAGRFFRDRRKFGTVSRQYWGARNGSGGNHLHHWAIPRRSGGPNAGWNLLDVHGGFNSWMNGTTLPRRAVEWGVRVGIPGTVVGGAVRGGQWGLERDEWRASCASR
jgi:RHS repeat-associated protein